MRSEEPGESRSAQEETAPATGNETTAAAGDTVRTEYEEQRNIRRLQLMMNLVMSVIAQDKKLTVEQAAEIVASSRKAALDMFPDKELAYNLIYKPRIQRLMRERFRIQ